MRDAGAVEWENGEIDVVIQWIFFKEGILYYGVLNRDTRDTPRHAKSPGASRSKVQSSYTGSPTLTASFSVSACNSELIILAIPDTQIFGSKSLPVCNGRAAQCLARYQIKAFSEANPVMGVPF